MGSTAIRNLGTIGGNLCHNEPGADLPPALLALNASVRVTQSEGHEKSAADRIFSRLFRDRCCAGGNSFAGGNSQLSLKARVSVYIKHSISAEDLAIAGVAVVVVPDDQKAGSVRELRIGLGGVAPVPFRAVKAEAVLNGKALNDDAIRAAAEIAAAEAEPMSDPHASADYRRKMVKVLVRRAIVAAMGQAERNGYGKA